MFKWITDGARATKLFGWVRYTKTGGIMDEIDDIFQPAADDIRAWKRIKDIGKFSQKTMKEFQEAWAVVPPKHKRILQKALVLLEQAISAKTLMKIIEVYLTSIKVEGGKA